MSSTRRAFLQGGTAALLGSTAPAFAQNARAPRLVLGQSIPMTGAASEIGMAFAGGAKLFVDAHNERGGGVTLVLRQLDDGYDPARARANAGKLLADGAELLFGFVGTASSSAAAEVAQQQGTLLFAPFAAPDSLRDKSHPQVFHVRPSLYDEAFAMVRHNATLGQKRIAMVADDDAMGQAALAAVQAALAAQKLAPLATTALLRPGDAALGAAVADVVKAQPQVVIQASLSPTTSAFVRAMRKAGYGAGFMAFSVVGIDPLYTALGKDIRGVVISQVVPSPRSATTPIVREYLAALNNSDQTASYEGLEGFIAAKALAEAARRAGTPGRAALQKAMAGMGDYDVGGFRINLRPPLHDAARPVELVYITAEGRVLR